MAATAIEMPPADVAERLFGADMWDTPREILGSVFRPRARSAVKACHASSKTHTAAIAAALALYEGGDVLTTAPTWEQVRTVLWGEIRRLINASVIKPRHWGDINQTQIVMPNGAQALGLSTNEGVRFQGFHARPHSFLLVIFDEAPGVLPSIYEAVEGISAGGDVRQLLIGNPIIASGHFFDIFEHELPGWDRFTIDAFDTPNLAGLSLRDLLALPEHALDDNPRPYLVTRRWVRDRYLEWGPEHALWQSRVRGEFPTEAESALLSRAWLDEASVDGEPGGEIVAGLDVAGPGEDETVLCVREGEHVALLRAWAQADTRGAVLAELAEWRHRGLVRLNVDAAGIGWERYRALADELKPAVQVVPVNVGERPTTPKQAERFANLKAELYWGLREAFRDGRVRGLRDRTTVNQLAGIRYDHDRQGRVQIEPKDKARERGVKSPDRAEAIMLAFAPPSPYDRLARALDQAQTRRPAEPPTDPFLIQVRKQGQGRAARSWGRR